MCDTHSIFIPATFFLGSNKCTCMAVRWIGSQKRCIVLKDRNQVLTSQDKIQYRPEGLQHLRARKMRVKEGPYARVTRKLRARNFLRALLHAPQLHANCVYFEEKRNPLLFIHALCVYFSGGEVKNVAVDLYRTCNSQAIIGNS